MVRSVKRKAGPETLMEAMTAPRWSRTGTATEFSPISNSSKEVA